MNAENRMTKENIMLFPLIKRLLGGSDSCWNHVAIILTKCDFSIDDFKNFEEY